MTTTRRSAARSIAADWVPPRIARALRGSQEPAAAEQPAATPAPTELAPPAPETFEVDDDPRWAALTERVLAELRECDELYRPTNFWGPGLDELLGDMERMGLSRFKRWPRAGFWFLPMYGQGFTEATIRQVVRRAKNVNPSATRDYVAPALNGQFLARRDHDVASMAWDHTRWPLDLAGFSESTIGDPWQLFPMQPGRPEMRYGRGYLNYLLVMSALSRHVEAPPKSVLELGGGFGVLGEILMTRDPDLRYVNLDIPPLVTVSSYYLTELFGDDRVLTYGPDVASEGPIDVPASACLPNWRITDISGPFDVFVNSYSFQEMEPHVVENYAQKVADLGVEYVVSLNSLKGKPRADEGHEIGVVDPVTSPRIIEMFEKLGYLLLATYGSPLVQSQGQVAILRKA